MNRIIHYKNGQALSYAEYGDKQGYPVLVQHGIIASIRDYHLFDSLINSGIRLICTARPGYGESSPYGMSRMVEWGELVSILVGELGLTHFDLLGMSSGAPYSYAIGYQLPDKVGNIFIFSGIPALYDETVLAVWPYEVNKRAGIPELQKLARGLFFSNPSPEALLQNDIQDSMRNDCFGIALDFHLRCNHWGFLLSDVKEKVYMQHGKGDDQVPFTAAEITSRLLPDCQFEVRERGGHFSMELLNSFIKTTVLQNVGK